MIAKSSKAKKVNDALSPGEKLFQKVVSFYATTHTQVERAMIFGFDCLRVNGKVFAKLHDGQFVMKLPANRLKDLVDSGQAKPYELRGHLTKEWGVILSSKDIIALAEEASVFSDN